MSFFDRAKAAASDLAAKADVAMANAGISVPGIGGDRALRDMGVLAWLEATGRPVDPADRERVMTALRELETAGRLGPLTVTPAEPYGTPRPRRGPVVARPRPRPRRRVARPRRPEVSCRRATSPHRRPRGVPPTPGRPSASRTPRRRRSPRPRRPRRPRPRAGPDAAPRRDTTTRTARPALHDPHVHGADRAGLTARGARGGSAAPRPRPAAGRPRRAAPPRPSPALRPRARRPRPGRCAGRRPR